MTITRAFTLWSQRLKSGYSVWDFQWKLIKRHIKPKKFHLPDKKNSRIFFNVWPIERGHWRLLLTEPANFGFSCWLIWLGTKLLNQAALQDFPHFVRLILRVKQVIQDLEPQCILWICNDTVWPLQIVGFKAWCSSWGLGLHALKHLIKYNFIDILNTTQWFHVLAGKRRRWTKKIFYFLTPVKTVVKRGLYHIGILFVLLVWWILASFKFSNTWLKTCSDPLSGNIFLINWLSHFYINPLDLIVHSFRPSQSGSVSSNWSVYMRLLTVLLFWFGVECEVHVHTASAFKHYLPLSIIYSNFE